MKTTYEQLLKGFRMEVVGDKVTLTFQIPKSPNSFTTSLEKIDIKKIPMLIPAQYRVSGDDHHISEPVIRDTYVGDSINLEHAVNFNTDFPQDKAGTSPNPIRVRVSFEAYIKLTLHSLKYAHPEKARTTWVEVIGLLTGYIEHDSDPTQTCLVIQDAHPIGHGDAVTAQIQDPNSVVKVYREKKKGHLILGWYHSHPSYSPFMSQTDFATQLRYQRLAKVPLEQQPIALVIDPTEIWKNSHGFKIFRLKEDYKTWDQPKFEVVNAPIKTIPAIIKTLLPLTSGKAVFLEYED